MVFKFRGSLKGTKEVVDILKFEECFAICGDGNNRHIDEFNTIFYPAQSFKKEILNIDKLEFTIEDVEDTPKVKKSK